MSLPAVILVGGQGTRLRPLTDRTRKDMLPLVDRPLLAYTFEHLARHGVERAVISCGYLPDQIEAGFGSRPRRPVARVRGRGRAARHRRRDRLRRARARRELLRAQRRLAARGRPRRAGRVPSLDGRQGDDPAHAGRRPESLRARSHGGGRPGRDVPREAAPGGDRHRSHQRRPVRARARGSRARFRRVAPSRSSARSFPGSLRKGSVYGIALPGVLARHRDARVVPPGAPRRARATLPDRGRRRSRRRLHARRSDCGSRSRRDASFPPCTSVRARSSRRVRVSGASPFSVRARGWQRAASWRTPSWALTSDRRRRVLASSAPSSETTRDLGAECELHNLAVVGPGASLGGGNVLDHGLRIGAGQQHPGRGAALLVSERLAAATACRRARSRSHGAGSSSGPRPTTTSASSCSFARASR